MSPFTEGLTSRTLGCGSGSSVVEGGEILVTLPHWYLLKVHCPSEVLTVYVTINHPFVLSTLICLLLPFLEWSRGEVASNMCMVEEKSPLLSPVSWDCVFDEGRMWTVVPSRVLSRGLQRDSCSTETKDGLWLLNRGELVYVNWWFRPVKIEDVLNLNNERNSWGWSRN